MPALLPNMLPDDPDLAAVVEVWDALPEGDASDRRDAGQGRLGQMRNPLLLVALNP